MEDQYDMSDDEYERIDAEARAREEREAEAAAEREEVAQ